MNDDLRRDAVDEELRRRFDTGASAAPDPDPDLVLDAMRPRLQQARMRRRAGFASAIAGVAVIVVVSALVLGGGGGGSGSVRVPPATRGSVSSVPPGPTTATAGGSAPPDTIPSGSNGGGFFNVDPTVPDATPSTEPAPVPTATSIVQGSYSSAGGSITVDLVDGKVSLTSSSPAPGFTDEVHDNGPTRVEVRFSNGETEWRIRVDVVDGQLVDEVTEH